MATPRELLGRAENRRPIPAPSQQKRSHPEPAEPDAARVIVPQPIRQNSVYRQLMRSHDRVHTRHLGDDRQK